MPYDPSQGTLKVLKRAYAEKTRRTIFFLGAGASAEAGLPTWWDLREGLHNRINQSVGDSADDKELDNFRELEERRENDNYWGYFEQAEAGWPTTYSDYLEEVFDLEVDKINTPVVYKKIWGMKGVKQVLTLNVDGILARAFQETKRTQNKTLIQYDGYSVTDSQAFFSRGAYCLLNLHGSIFQKSRWIMSDGERRRLHEGESGKKYTDFLTWLFQTHNIVFVGMNPRDIAVSHAIQLAEKTSLLGKHFWICPSPTGETRRWAEKNGIRLVSYSPDEIEDGTKIHSTEICSILDDLEAHVSEDPPIELPVSSAEVDPTSLESPADLVTMLSTDRPTAVKRMSGAATRMGREYGFSSSQLDALIKENSLPIQIATSLDARTPPFNQIGNYKLVNKVQGGGGFNCLAL